MYTNPNGIIGKTTSLMNNLQEYQCNICCLAETKLQHKPPNIEGYYWEFKNRNNKGGGGVAILISNTMKTQTSRVTEIEDQDQEIIWIETKQGTHKTYIGCYYGPQESTLTDEIEREMSQLQTQIIKLKKNGSVILTGDFNAKLEVSTANHKQNESRNGKHLRKMIKNSDLIPISIKPDRGFWTRENR